MSIPVGAYAEPVPFWRSVPGLPPMTNRGVEMEENSLKGVVKAHIDYLSITVHGDVLGVVLAAIGQHFHDLPPDRCSLEQLFDPVGRGARGYAEMHQSPHGYTLFVKPFTGRHLHLEVKGECCTALGSVRIQRFLQAVHGSGDRKWSPSRVDIAFDHCPFTPAQIREAWRAGAVETRLHPSSFSWQENAEGHTAYLGGKQSPRKVCCYDKRGFTRYELRLREYYAEAMIPSLLDGGFEVVALNMIRGMCAFKTPWWAAFVKAGEGITIAPTVAQTPAYRARDRYWQDLLRHVSAAAPLARAFGCNLAELITQVELDEQGSRVEERARHAIGACIAR